MWLAKQFAGDEKHSQYQILICFLEKWWNTLSCPQMWVCTHFQFAVVRKQRKFETVTESQNRDITLPTKVCLVKAMVFPVVMYGCESWTIKKAEHRKIDAFELWCCRKCLRVPWIGKDIQPVNPKGNQFWIFIRRTGAEAETPILWPPDAKNWLIGKDPHAGTDWRREEKRWHRRLNGHEFEQALGVDDGQGSLECFSPWGCKESDVTEQLN